MLNDDISKDDIYKQLCILFRPETFIIRSKVEEILLVCPWSESNVNSGTGTLRGCLLFLLVLLAFFTKL